MKRTVAISIFLFAITLSACGKAPEIPIPVGVRTVHGYLQSVPFSLKRRGTHGLFSGSGGKLLFYAESTAVNLRALEGREVDLQGTFEANSDTSALPVMIVTAVTDGGEQTKPWTIPALGISLTLPKTWKGSIQGKSASFTASGFTVPVLTIKTVTVPPTSQQPTYGPASLPASSELLVVGLKKASADITADGNAWLVSVAITADQQLQFRFAVRASDVDDQIASYRKILRTVEFRSGSSPARTSSSPSFIRSSPGATNTSASATSRAAGEGSPCGGVAGILCPKGLFCTITDAASETGVCVKK